ncbi:phenylalanine-tRNA ligase [Cryptococcus gattii Ru294]|uniref:phenylalanine--tRNA ligase n=2 Tax=Cryptococcus gattii TaxID=37769 RepID=E6R2P1_CRYGW|nr:Phenylalanyl-tRNA synthetase, putative [Cryptococcus gattii WM276]KIR55336.1 phenylalanine-tRNA ligase [Cryptococcus gattii Ru294]KIR82242.1 phenylalanine-tRNA ligase [Cryptococcus gattii EJB2]KIY33271.1 phenylalanine-tRNA ligase [Cryptococcus gattii E566]KJE03597.1 phenylalanine-tRNA ligase [Cryptococcus gattii NT-10]ADV20747.1 Phenylalanyl-tRNA synthetase, putative [Cryptococcus gattii WM276]
MAAVVSPPVRARLALLRPRALPGRRFQSSGPPAYVIAGERYPRDAHSNTPPSILAKTGRNLHLQPAHPLSILRQIIQEHFAAYTPLTPRSPAVSVWQNFDELGFPPDHPGRSPSDSYYLNKHHMLRTHTSAHEVESYRRGLDRWLLSADVYRRDEIDASHYPVFHQMEGTHVWPLAELHTLPALNAQLEASLAACPIRIEDDTRISPSNPYQPTHDPVHAAEITRHLKHSLNSLIFRLFGHITKTNQGEPLRVRWIEAYFPFTTPSYEVEVWWEGEWLELLGCGVVMQKTLDEAGVPDKAGWAFGLGLERLSMVLFSIPDIRLFWTTDQRFHSQFSQGQITTFKPYSRYPECYKDMSFWLPVGSIASAGQVDSAGGASAAGGKGRVFHENDYYEIVREVAGDLVETVSLIDEFTHPKTNRQSRCYRLNYRHMDRSLSNEEVNALQEEVQKRVVDEMGIEMR